MTINLQHWQPVDIKVLRFAFGMSLVSIIAYSIAWPMAFLTVLMTGKLLMADKSTLTLKESFGLIIVVTVAMYASFFVSVAFINYPVLFTLIITLALLRIFYIANKGARPVMVILLLVGVTVVPMLAQQSQEVAYEAVKMLVMATILAVVFALISYVAIPGGANDKQEEKTEPDKDALPGAVKSTLVVVPLYLYIFLTNNPEALLILIFVAILAQDTSLDKGIKSGTGLILGNIIGGVVGILIYNLLVVIPSLGFFVLLMITTWLLVGRQIFKPGLLGVLFGIGFATINVVLSGALGFVSDDASTSIYQRLFQLFLVTLYIVIAFSVVDSVANLLMGKERRGVQTVH